MKFEVSPLDPSELKLCLATWKRSLRERVKLPTTAFYALAEVEIEGKILANLPLLLAARMGRVCVGWICAEPDSDGVFIRYCYVKSAYRRRGVAKHLLAGAIERLADASGDGLMYDVPVWPEYREAFDRYGLERVDGVWD